MANISHYFSSVTVTLPQSLEESRVCLSCEKVSLVILTFLYNYDKQCEHSAIWDKNPAALTDLKKRFL